MAIFTPPDCFWGPEGPDELGSKKGHFLFVRDCEEGEKKHLIEALMGVTVFQQFDYQDADYEGGYSYHFVIKTCKGEILLEDSGGDYTAIQPSAEGAPMKAVLFKDLPTMTQNEIMGIA